MAKRAFPYRLYLSVFDQMCVVEKRRMSAFDFKNDVIDREIQRPQVKVPFFTGVTGAVN